MIRFVHLASWDLFVDRIDLHILTDEYLDKRFDQFHTLDYIHWWFDSFVRIAKMLAIVPARRRVWLVHLVVVGLIVVGLVVVDLVFVE